MDTQSYTPSNYSAAQIPDIGVNTYSKPVNMGWADAIGQGMKAWGEHKTRQVTEEYDNKFAAIQTRIETDPNVLDTTQAAAIMRKKEQGAANPQDLADLDTLVKKHGNLSRMLAQGKLSERGYNLEAAAVLREAVKRRPDLVNELNDMASKATGQPSLGMLMHRYYTEDNAYVGGALEAQAKPPMSFSQVNDVLIQMGRTVEDMPNQADKEAGNIMLADARQKWAQGDLEGTVGMFNSPSWKGLVGAAVGGGAGASILEAQAPVDVIKGKLVGLGNMTTQFQPGSEQYNAQIAYAEQAKLEVMEANRRHSAIDSPQARELMKQNEETLAQLNYITSKTDSPEKTNNTIKAWNELRNRNLSGDSAYLIASSLSDMSKEQSTEVQVAWDSGETNIKHNYINGPTFVPPNPSVLGNLTRTLFASNPNGEKLNDKQKRSNFRLFTGVMANWALDIKDSNGRLIPRAVEDYTDPRAGVLVTTAQALPAMQSTYMSDAAIKADPANTGAVAGMMVRMLDQANLSAKARLSSEGLGEFVERRSLAKTVVAKKAPDWRGGLVIVGKPSAEQRKRIEDTLQTLKTRTYPIEQFLDSRFPILGVGVKPASDASRSY